MAVTRRRLLAAGAASGAAIWLPEAASVADAASRRRVPLARAGGFASGVMSGAPGDIHTAARSPRSTPTGCRPSTSARAP